MSNDEQKAVFSKDEPGEIDLLGMGAYARSLARLTLLSLGNNVLSAVPVRSVPVLLS